jgi:hypothetical protein
VVSNSEQRGVTMARRRTSVFQNGRITRENSQLTVCQLATLSSEVTSPASISPMKTPTRVSAIR